ncbi:DNA replication and repair protein RecF [Filifactor alocis ATCC 35896]|uniref:DNA replication and repair protein RecF n=1 Tax=Filifactor alocis (strain ATCC 35896 / CCUG 47790 / D40 B5) TaxID=546269 RepID=D6GSU8_FILAD|nr:DNA replication/repair protein RecF [Filifactor alocis]EFE27933.1 DNA replication and repair protein RecF [Filifactor alocis ATCC 35896]
MKIHQLTLKNFRNYEQLELLFKEGANVFVGQNGQGKTNVLEAISLFSVGRSFRTVRDLDMVAFGQDAATVSAIVENLHGRYTIDMKLGKSIKKAVKINSVPIEKLQDLFGVLNIVVFSPDDLKLVKDGPKERRLFLDREISQLKPRYYRILSEYYKVLNQRNTLLKQEVDEVLLEIYTQQIAKSGFQIHKMREEFIEHIREFAQEIHSKISSKKEVLEIEYEPNVYAISEEEYFRYLMDGKEHDFIRKHSTRGIHKDDVALVINEMDIRHFGSQGQKRSAAISLKLSEIQMIYQDTGEYPIVLLDDIFSELDYSRQRMLLDYVTNTQVFVTTAEKFLDNGKIYAVENGKISVEEG